MCQGGATAILISVANSGSRSARRKLGLRQAAWPSLGDDEIGRGGEDRQGPKQEQTSRHVGSGPAASNCCVGERRAGESGMAAWGNIVSPLSAMQSRSFQHLYPTGLANVCRVPLTRPCASTELLVATSPARCPARRPQQPRKWLRLHTNTPGRERGGHGHPRLERRHDEHDAPQCTSGVLHGIQGPAGGRRCRS